MGIGRKGLIEEVYLGRCFVSVGCCVLQVEVDVECITGIVRVCGGVN